MFAPVKLLTLAAAVGPAMGAYLGFNYGNTFTNGAIKTEADFEAEFKAAQSLAGAPGFTSARLYTMVVSVKCLRGRRENRTDTIPLSSKVARRMPLLRPFKRP